MNQSNGFTLIELSIVLIIIGLITGGVLVGQDMIKSATIKKQIRQIQEHDKALNAFVLKYNWLPGDCGSLCESSGFGLVNYTIASPGLQQNGIINGTTDDYSGDRNEGTSSG